MPEVVMVPTEDLLNDRQIKALARPLLKKISQIRQFYEDPENRRAFVEWYIKKYGHPPTDPKYEGWTNKKAVREGQRKG